uniref:Uncharacterized protein n=1 Tax=Tetranychus urticae TaxID=32264 RepID=T1KY23_TETUR
MGISPSTSHQMGNTYVTTKNKWYELVFP